MLLIRELFFKLKEHPSAVASWLAAIVMSNSESNVNNNAIMMSETINLIQRPSKSIDGENEKRATLEEAGDSSFLL